MPNRMRGLGLRPVNSIKHVIDIPTSVVTSIVTTIPLADSFDNPALSSVEAVTGGSQVNNIYLRVEVRQTSGSSGIPRIYMTVMKNPGNNLAVPPPNAIGSDDDKKWIIHQEMMMLSDTVDTQIPRTLFQGVIRVPPKLRRMGVRDRISVHFQHGVAESSQITNVCIQAIYKEFR